MAFTRLSHSFPSVSTYDILGNGTMWNLRRHHHPACRCTRDMEFEYDNITYLGCCPRVPLPNMMEVSDMMSILSNKTILFAGDSVVAQEECNLRCLMADYFMSERWVEGIRFFTFQQNISIGYYQIGGWNYEHKGQCHRNGTEQVLSRLGIDTVYFNIGNHFRDADLLKCALESYANIIHYFGVKMIFRLQNPAHFGTVDGRLGSTALGQAASNACLRCYSGQSHISSIPYTVGHRFASKLNISFIDISGIANNPCYHPRFHDGISVHDCLHFPQDGYILSALNSATLRCLNDSNFCH